VNDAPPILPAADHRQYRILGNGEVLIGHSLAVPFLSGDTGDLHGEVDGATGAGKCRKVVGQARRALNVQVVPVEGGAQFAVPRGARGEAVRGHPGDLSRSLWPRAGPQRGQGRIHLLTAQATVAAGILVVRDAAAWAAPARTPPGRRPAGGATLLAALRGHDASGVLP
jgi:hypothetical protein